jgi:hypothetical protein
VARNLDAAAHRHGFFYAVLIDRLVWHARAFFAQNEAAKTHIPMSPAAVRCAATSP